uniref:Fatty acid hydroxylase domain-containing protein n=1 Tax=Pseudictyota dubia TaxID=2749911 RepID=A0A7R9W2V0_9STRA
MTTNARDDDGGSRRNGPDEGVDPYRKSSIFSAATVATPLTILFYGIVVLSVHRADAAAAAAVAANASSDDDSSGDFGDSFSWEHIVQLKDRIMEGPDGLEVMDLVLLGTISVLALELLNFLVKRSGYWFHAKFIPVRGKHLDELSSKDNLFIGLNKLATAPFVYFMVRYMFYEPNSSWAPRNITWMNTLLPLPIIFVAYDFFYTLLHWALHIKAIYGYIHKHHHHQKAPSRANVDAVNVHPIEYFLGEYNHIFACFLYCRVMGMELHIAAIVLFLVIGGTLAGLNHTRFDCVVKLWGATIYDSKHHDVHHRIPQSNYGQYIMLWDRIFGSFRDYDPNDRINPKAQLDQATGKSIEYMNRKKGATKVE